MARVFRSLFWRIALLVFAVFVLVGGLYVYIFLFTAEMYVQETDQRLNRGLASQVAARVDSLIEPTLRTEDIKVLLADLAAVHPGVEPYLVDTTGRILATPLSHPPATHIVDLEPVRSYLAGDMSGMYLGDDPCGLVEEKVFSAAPVTRAGGDILGYIYIVLHGQEYDSLMDRLFDSYILMVGWRSFSITLAGAIGISLIILAFLLSRLRRLTVSVREFGAGKYETRAPVRSDDEIGELARTFNTMANTIQTNIDDLRESDIRRREFFANISHDLKTPLTSIQGFIETLLLKWESIPSGQREQYLRTVLNRTERLGAMVHQILELSRLEARETSLSPESIDVNDMLSDLFLEFGPRADTAGISLSSDVQADLPSLRGDIGLIERALRNLLDNAVRHSPTGSTVTVAVRETGGWTSMSVSDQGPGIPSDQLPHVFDRFYRGDKSRTGRTANTGLGLPITKRIAEMHGGSIAVQSTPGSGTTFTISIPTREPDTKGH